MRYSIVERQAFLDRLNHATQRATALAREMVINHLPTPVQYALLLNQSYDGNPLGPAERVFLKDMRTHEPAPVDGEQVVKALWRNGEVPEWIDINVEAAGEEWTLVNLRCCGRYTAMDEHLYHQAEGHPPFHVHSPPMPPGMWKDKSREKFDLFWRRTKMDQEMSLLYPDVTKHACFGDFLNAQFNAIGSSLRFRRGRVEHGHRFMQINRGLKERLFVTDFWDRGVSLGHLAVPEVGPLIAAANTWCVEQRPLSYVVNFAPTLRFDQDQVTAFEAGPAAFTEWRWAKMLKAAVDAPQNKRLLPAIRAASETTELKQLFPYTSMMRLGFSRCTGYPFSGDCPLIVPIFKTETFQVLSGSGEVVGKGDVHEAMTLAVQHLPEGFGAAVHGTADDLTDEHDH